MEVDQALDPLDALAAQHGAQPGSAAPAAADPLDALARTHGADVSPMTFAIVNGQRVPVSGDYGRAGAYKQAMGTLVDALPAMGGVAGGMLGAATGIPTAGLTSVPAATVGAGILGAGGEALKQLLDRFLLHRQAPDTSGEAAKDIGISGGTQAGLELGGRAATGLATTAGRSLMSSAVRPVQAIRDSFPDWLDTIMQERIPVGKGMFGTATGSERMRELQMASSRNLRALLARAEAAGTTFSHNDVSAPVLDLIDQIAKQPAPGPDLHALDGMIGDFLRSHPGPLTPTAVKDLKQAAQSIATPIFKAAERGFPVGADQTMKARFNGAIASGAKGVLETLPGVAEQEGRTQSLIGATRALRAAEGRRLPLSAEMISAAAPVMETMLSAGSPLSSTLRRQVTSYLMARGLMSPRVTSRVALALTQRQAQQVLRQFPRLAEAVAEQLQSSPSSGSPMVTSK